MSNGNYDHDKKMLATLRAQLTGAQVDQRNAVLKGDPKAAMAAADNIVQIQKLIKRHGG